MQRAREIVVGGGESLSDRIALIAEVALKGWAKIRRLRGGHTKCAELSAEAFNQFCPNIGRNVGVGEGLADLLAAF